MPSSAQIAADTHDPFAAIFGDGRGVERPEQEELAPDATPSPEQPDLETAGVSSSPKKHKTPFAIRIAVLLIINFLVGTILGTSLAHGKPNQEISWIIYHGSTLLKISLLILCAPFTILFSLGCVGILAFCLFSFLRWLITGLATYGD